MKKSKIIIIGVVVALMLVGGAYAAWTAQTDLTVNASAGELDVEISEVSVASVSSYVVFDNSSISISQDKKSASISIENLYPGANASADFEMTNIGTMPIAIDKVVQQTLEVINTKTNETLSDSMIAALNMSYKAYITDASGSILVDLGTVAISGSAGLSTFFESISDVINPGEKLMIEMTISMKETAEDDTENLMFKFKVTPFFTQGN